MPKNAVAFGKMQLLPGSNPVFGFNTLGGALDDQHEGRLPLRRGRRGCAHRGLVRAHRARRGRRIRNGGSFAAFAAFGRGEMDDNGWREHSPTRIRPAVRAAATAVTSATTPTVAVTLADNHLEGTQALPVSMLGGAATGVHVAGHHRQPARFRQRPTARTLDDETVVRRQRLLPRREDEQNNSNVNGEVRRRPEDPFEGVQRGPQTATTRGHGARRCR